MIDRINQALLRWIRRRGGVRIDSVLVSRDSLKGCAGSGTVWEMTWKQMLRVTAYMNEEFVGDTMVLVFESAADQRVVTEDLAGWSELTRVLPEHLPGAAAFASWAPAVTAHHAQEAIIVFQRGREHV